MRMDVDGPLVPPMDLRQVLYFVTVAQELNFTRAAKRLRISAPALSQQVKALERHLGVQLLSRDTRHVKLTAAGQVLVPACERLLYDAEVAVYKAQSAAGVIHGRLALACLHEAETTFEPFLTAFHSAYPGIQFVVTTMRQAELVTALRDGTVDAALTWSFLIERGGHFDGLRWAPVASTDVLAVLPSDHPLATCDRVPRGESLRTTPVVLFERAYSPVTFDFAIEELYGSDVTDAPVHEIRVTVRAQEAMARSITKFSSLAPLARPVADLFRGTAVVLPFDPPWVMQGCVLWRRDNGSAALVAFMAAATAEGVQPRSSRSAAAGPQTE